jgi:hypothetical protein
MQPKKFEMKNHINNIRQTLLIKSLEDINQNAKKSHVKINTKTIREFIAKYDEQNYIKEKEINYFCNDSNHKGVMEIKYCSKNPKTFINFHKEEICIKKKLKEKFNEKPKEKSKEKYKEKPNEKPKEKSKEKPSENNISREKPFSSDNLNFSSSTNSNFSSLTSNFSTLTSKNSKISTNENDKSQVSIDFLMKLVKSIKKL